MSLLDDILIWSETKLPEWQRDVVRRLFQQEDGLSNDDYNEVYTLLKVAYGFPNPLGIMPKPLNLTHLPAMTQVGETVILKAIRDLKYVNRIAPEQKISFAPFGMTVIYGGNGSGKSGYTRVMKRACRARDLMEKVHPDANDQNAQNCIPEAIFDIEINGTSKVVKWTSNNDSPVELSSISVFDSHCARAYLTSEQDVAYLPYGLDVVENLANKVLPELTRRLNEEISTIDVNRQPFQHLINNTEVGKLINTLNELTDPGKVKTLGTLSETEKIQIQEIDAALAEPDPKKKSIELRLSANRLKSLSERIEKSLSWVDDTHIEKLKQITNTTISTNLAEKQAAAVLQSGESLLPGTGEQTWKALFDSAKKFSTEIAYPDYSFPYTDSEAKCVLCQQPLNNVKERLNRFEEYIQNDIAKTATEQRNKLDAMKIQIERVNLHIGLDETLIQEITSIDDTIILIINAFEKKIETRRKWILKNLESFIWDDTPILDGNPRQKLRDLAAQQLKSSRIFSRAVDEDKKETLKNNRNELRARENLSVCLDSVNALIERLRMVKALKKCEQDLKTRSISDKSKEFASNAVTIALKKALDEEFKYIGIDHIKTKFKERPDKGKMFLQLLLDIKTTNKVEQILSEGEQRAIALGSFLAELNQANHSCGIVFDDPVSSLDHKRRRKVAKRLVEESKKRQVLIFTHDIVFLYQLQNECDKLTILPNYLFLEAKDGNFGWVSEGLPWDHKTYKDRIDSLEKAQKKLKKIPWPADPSEQQAREMIRQYSFLRATIERVVQDFVLNSTIQRFNDYIQVKNLKGVIGLEKSEVDEILRLNQRCNDIVEAHDPASIKDESPPTADELNQDITDLKNLIQIIADRRKTLKP